MKKVSKMLWIMSVVIIMLTVLTRQVESYPDDDELTLEALESEGYYSSNCYYFSSDGWDNGFSKFNNLYCVEKGDIVPTSNAAWSLKTKAVISGNDVTFYKCSGGNQFSTGKAGTSGEHNNKIAAILCEDDFDLGRYTSSNRDTTSQTSLWSYWNDWVSLSGASSYGMKSDSGNEGTYETEYDQYIEDYEYNVTIYYFEPTSSGNQNLILVTRGEIEVYTPEYINITVTKEWKDNNNSAGKRPSNITINLYANGEIYDTKIMTGSSTEDKWEDTFENIPETIDKKEVQYSVEEVVPEGYTMTQQNKYEE